jgi:hypothetical protein
MRHCYICDAAIPGEGFRRVVRTGTSNWIHFGKRVSTSHGERKGLRTVCASCAHFIDGRRIIAGLAIFGFIIYAISGTNPPQVNTSPSNTSSTVSDTAGSTPPQDQGPSSGFSARAATTSPIQQMPNLPIPAWRHITTTENRWSLHQVPGGLLLLIDLGNGQVANVRVAPQFLKLNLYAMNERVDLLKAYILQRWTTQSATYVYMRDGTVSQVQP